MIKGLVITPPLIGRVSIGERVENNGRQLPKKSDEFHLTTNVKQNNQWQTPPIPEAKKNGDEKLRSIPVRIMFNTPDNNLRAGYSCFSPDGRQICSGDGEKATRVHPRNGLEKVDCVGHSYCEFGKSNRCKPYGRLIVAMESLYEKDPLAGFVFRTTSYNSIKTLTFRLRQFAAMTANKMAGMPCNLLLRGKSTSASKGQPIYYCDLEPREGMFAAISEVRSYQQKCADQGIDLDAIDKAVKDCFDAAPYFEAEDDAGLIADEFFSQNTEPDSETGTDRTGNKNASVTNINDGHQRQNFHHRQNNHQQPADPDNSGDQNTASHQEPSTAEGGVQDMLGQEHAPPQESSKAFADMIAKIKTISDPNSAGAAHVWISNNRELANPQERQMAFAALESRIAELKKQAA